MSGVPGGRPGCPAERKRAGEKRREREEGGEGGEGGREYS